ncbi:hypothetical protein [Actinomycetospora termitidis]|uniref:Uncharacterized protein n=1 Tax=Actinomycetospora termitidis TaxID=3053470 RepID=A0ABT7MDJ2_9PSEU|nr:hypothetical protein [Actinomycetospora sp. Odt1-22]MDL5158725.1 hypothetical protein [Actinomycetospora sp. Odt1-22]
MGALDGRVVLILGGTGDHGRAVVDELVADGATVEILDEDAEAARAAARRHGGPWGRVAHRPLEPGACAELIRAAVARTVADRGVLTGIVTVDRSPAEVLAVLRAARAPLRAARYAAVVLVGSPEQTRTLAEWLADDGVRINSVRPSGVPLDTAHAVHFLLSDAAADVTGTDWPAADRDAAIPRRASPTAR